LPQSYRSTTTKGGRILSAGRDDERSDYDAERRSDGHSHDCEPAARVDMNMDAACRIAAGSKTE
jgi:hypothetical protein